MLFHSLHLCIVNDDNGDDDDDDDDDDDNDDDDSRTWLDYRGQADREGLANCTWLQLLYHMAMHNQ